MHTAIGVPNVGEYGDPRLIADLARAAEQAGWDGLFLWDHVLYWQPSWPLVDPWIALSAAAMATERIRLGVLMTAVARRRPWILARQTASLDHLSGGRLIMGAALGSMREEYAAFGEDADLRLRATLLDEGLEIIVGLWSGEPFRFAGQHLQVNDAVMRPMPAQRPRIPIWVGGAWPHRGPFRRAARWDGMMPTHVSYGKGETMPPAELAKTTEFVAAERGSLKDFD
ncbi:MAG: LLM class flavin-dependent oxidoreductase, partial [Pseudonocardiaceae bacterium]